MTLMTRNARKNVREAIKLYEQDIVTEQFLREVAAYSLCLEIQSTLALKTKSKDAKLRKKLRYFEGE